MGSQRLRSLYWVLGKGEIFHRSECDNRGNTVAIKPHDAESAGEANSSQIRKSSVPSAQKYKKGSKIRVASVITIRYDCEHEGVAIMKAQLSSAKDYQRIEKAILFLEKNVHRKLDLKEIAKSINLSEYHFQRLFKRWAGISPKRFLQVLTLEHAKEALKNSGSLLNVTYEAELSSPGSLHDLFVNMEAVTPDKYRKQGAGLEIGYGFHPSPFGECLVAVTSRGISNLAFVP